MSVEILKKYQLRVTPFRVKVLDIFLEHDSAVSATDIEESLGQFDRVTLYRTIKSFIDKGVIHEILIAGGVKKLALCQDSCTTEQHNHNHVHFHCDNCHETYCVDVSSFPKIELEGFNVSNVEVQVQGVCKFCNKTNS